LAISLGGLFELDRKEDKLSHSSSMAAMLTTPVEVPVLHDLEWTSSLPVQAEASEVGRK